MQIAKSGYWGGDPEKVAKAAPDWIIKTFEYQSFCDEYQHQLNTLNSKD